LATFTAILVAKIFFYPPWQPKQSQLGALHIRINCILTVVFSESESVFKEEALVEELTSVLREWGAMWKQVYLVS